MKAIHLTDKIPISKIIDIPKNAKKLIYDGNIPNTLSLLFTFYSLSTPIEEPKNNSEQKFISFNDLNKNQVTDSTTRVNDLIFDSFIVKAVAESKFDFKLKIHFE